MNKAKMNYWVDVVIGLSGAISALSGMVFLLQGELGSGVLGVSYQTWNTVHTWSSLMAVAGASAHIALHWKWMVSMTKQVLPFPGSREAKLPATAPAYGVAGKRSVSRRAFLAFGGAAAAASIAILAGFKAFLGASAVEASQSGDQIAATQQETGVACPFGVANDPSPGRCRHYRDANGDGICDHSVEGSGGNLLASNAGSLGGDSARPGPGFGRP